MIFTKRLFLFAGLFLSSMTVFGQKYVFYLHGRIIETQGVKAFDSINGFGAYQYSAILDSLRRKDLTILSEVRSKNTDVKLYAFHIKHQIDSLLSKGVKPENITVIGASKGSVIAMLVSSTCKNENLNFVFMAACHPELLEQYPELEFYGNVLSIFEKSDSPFAGSCLSFKNKSAHLKRFKEIELNTGLRHGFLYKPMTEWMNPTVKWAKANYN